MKDIRVIEPRRSAIKGEWAVYAACALLFCLGAALRLDFGGGSAAYRDVSGAGFSLRLPASLAAAPGVDPALETGQAVLEQRASWNAKLAGLPVRAISAGILRAVDPAFGALGPVMLLTSFRKATEREYALRSSSSGALGPSREAFLMVGSRLDPHRPGEVLSVTCLIDYIFPAGGEAFVLSFQAEPGRLPEALAFAEKTAKGFSLGQGGAK